GEKGSAAGVGAPRDPGGGRRFRLTAGRRPGSAARKLDGGDGYRQGTSPPRRSGNGLFYPDGAAIVNDPATVLARVSSPRSQAPTRCAALLTRPHPRNQEEGSCPLVDLALASS